MEEKDLSQKMLDAGMHLGVRRFLVHPKMRKFIFTFRDDLALINLTKSVELWEKTFEYLTNAVTQGKTILFLATQPAAREIVARVSRELGVPYMTKRWLGGTLTNFDTFRKRLDTLAQIEAKIASPDFAKYTKKEQGQMQAEAKEIREKFDGLVGLQTLPDVLFVFCGRKHRTALEEARRMGIPVVGIFSLDDNPDDAAAFIPVSDNATPAVEITMAEIAKLYREHRPVAAAAVAPAPEPQKPVHRLEKSEK
jgi:small subunit ribosomal protein S2